MDERTRRAEDDDSPAPYNEVLITDYGDGELIDDEVVCRHSDMDESHSADS